MKAHRKGPLEEPAGVRVAVVRGLVRGGHVVVRGEEIVPEAEPVAAIQRQRAPWVSPGRAVEAPQVPELERCY